MKVGLVFTNLPGVIGNSNTNFKNMAFRDENIGHIPPVSLVNVATILEGEGVEVEIIDQDAEGLSYRQVLSRLDRFSPDLVGFTLTTYNFRDVLPWIKSIKEDTGLPTLVGGPHLHLYPHETLSHNCIDYAIIGEAEIPLPQFMKAFKGNRDFSGIKSVGYRDSSGKVHVENTRQSIPDLNDLPLPALHLLKNHLYSNILTRKKNFTAMLSARGCPYRCTFCDQKVPVFRRRSADNFVSEVVRNYEEFGIREFDVYDSTFTAHRKRVIEICDKLANTGLDIGWTIRTRVDSVNEKVIDALKRGGVHTILYGIESSNEDILKVMKKGIAKERIEKTLAYTKGAGIDTLGFFMFGFPGETRETIENTIEFALKQPLDYAQFSTLVPMPETEIYDYYRERGMDDYWSFTTLNPESNRSIDLIEVELNREETEALSDRANRQFYVRPRIVWKQLILTRSLERFRRLTSATLFILQTSLSRIFSSNGNAGISADRNSWFRRNPS